ncbi:MAG: metalloregulator ArsR/SmtB family transcription factor [Planctomycetota bacterium]
MAHSEKLARIFKALASDTRVRIVQLLAGRALCVGALSARLDVTQGAVSQHLRILREAGLVVAQKRGYYVHYRLNEKALAKLSGEVAWLLRTPQKKGARRCVRRKRVARGRRT